MLREIRLLIFSIFTLLLWATASLGAPPSFRHTHREIARTKALYHLKQNQYDVAQIELLNHLRGDKYDTQTWNLLGLTYLKAQRFLKAASAFGSAAELVNHPDSADDSDHRGIYLYYQADAFARAGRFTDSGTSLAVAIREARVGNLARQAMDLVSNTIKYGQIRRVLASRPLRSETSVVEPGRGLPDLKVLPDAQWSMETSVQTGYDSNVLMFSESSLSSGTLTGQASPYIGMDAKVGFRRRINERIFESYAQSGVTFFTQRGANSFNSIFGEVGAAYGNEPEGFSGFTQSVGITGGVNTLNLSGIDLYGWRTAVHWQGLLRMGSQTHMTWTLPIGYQYYKQNVGDLGVNNRDGLTVIPSIMVQQLFGNTQLNTGLRLENIFTEGNNFQSFGGRIPVILSRPLPWMGVMGNLIAEPFLTTYPRSAVGSAAPRLDGGLTLGLSFNRRFFGHWNSTLGYLFRWNGSNQSANRYQKHILTAVIRYEIL